MSPNTILITSKHHAILVESCHVLGFQTHVDLQFNLDSTVVNKENVVGIVTSNSFQLDAHTIDLFPALKFIGRLGSGMEIIDVAYAESKGIQCYSSPLGNANAVAEHALGMLLNLLNNMHRAHLALKEEVFLRDTFMGRELADLKVGIIGYGSNGKMFAHKLADLGAQVHVYDINPGQYDYYSTITFCDDIESLYDVIDCISLHIPINAVSPYYMDHLLPNFKNPLFFINCARGKLVSAKALYEGLENGRLLGVGIDVWEEEPIQNMSKERREYAQLLIKHPLVIATPHIAGYTHQAFYKMSKIIANHLRRFKMAI